MPRPTLVCFTIVAAFQLHVAAAGVVSEDVPVPGGMIAMAQSLGIRLPPDRARFVAELARLVHPAADGRQTTRAKAASMLRRTGADPPVRFGAPVESVPIPLSVSVWSRAVFRHPVAPEDIFAAILSDPRAAYLCYGLAGSDDETLQFFIDHPDVLTQLYDHSAAAFAAFGSSLHIHGNRIVPTGGTAAGALWEAVVGEKLDRPEAFIRRLFGLDQGRLAYLHDTIADLDRPRAAFALGLWMRDPDARVRRFKALAAVNRTAFPQWQATKFPFSRPLHDIGSLLARVQVEPDGSPSFPPQRSAWTWIFESVDAPLDPPHPSANVVHDEPVDAAWLARAIVSVDTPDRGVRLDQLAFGQRAFRVAGVDEFGDILVAIRGFPRYRMMMLVLERTGVRHGSVYVAAERRAQQLSSLAGRRAFVALGQFQGVLALLARMAAVQTLDVAAAEALITSLSNVPLDSDGRYGGSIANWLQRDLRAALKPVGARLGRDATPSDDARRVPFHSDDEMEDGLLAALAGPRSVEQARAPIQWEGQTYRLDLAASEEHRLRRIREKQGSPPIDLSLAIAGIAGALASNRVSVNDVVAARAVLKNVAVEALPIGLDGVRQGRDVIDRALEDLAKVGAQADVGKAAHVAAPLAALADELLADALMAWTYALSVADASSPVLLGGHATRRHDFGLQSSTRLGLPREWALPRQHIAAGATWHVSGSLLGLDVALSMLALRRVNGDRVIDAPSLSVNEREAFAEAVALLNPVALRDEDGDAIADGVRRGRQRVASLAENSGALDQIAEAIHMDGWRKRALQWTLSHEPGRMGSLFSMTELLYLGETSLPDLDAWGMSAIASSGCLCTRLAPPNQWRLLLGRPQVGLMAATMADLNLHVAILLRELQLPAAIAKSVLAAAVQDFIDEVTPTDANDWLTLVRAAQNVTRERVEDYVAAATADGPLVATRGDTQP